MENIYRTEINLLVVGLIERGIRFTVTPVFDGYKVEWDVPMFSGDAICHNFSYGGTEGLLEIMGALCNTDDDVEGFLTANEILRRFDELINTGKIRVG